MTINASDCTWAKAHFSDTAEAQAALEQLKGEIKALKKALAEGWFDGEFTAKEMRKELAKMEDAEEELVDLLFADVFDLL